MEILTFGQFKQTALNGAFKGNMPDLTIYHHAENVLGVAEYIDEFNTVAFSHLTLKGAILTSEEIVQLSIKERVNVLAKHLGIDSCKITRHPDKTCKLTVVSDDGETEEEYYVYTYQERESFARDFAKDAISDGGFHYYSNLAEVTGLSIELLRDMFLPWDDKNDRTVDNVYRYLILIGALEKYVDVFLKSEDIYLELFSPSLNNGTVLDGWYIYRWS